MILTDRHGKPRQCERAQLEHELAAARMEAEANQSKATGLARALGDVTQEKEKLQSELADAKANQQYGWETAREAHKVYEKEHTELLTARNDLAHAKAEFKARNALMFRQLP